MKIVLVINGSIFYKYVLYMDIRLKGGYNNVKNKRDTMYSL